MEQTAESEIKTRIALRGKISFHEFMEIALYHPADGYYQSTHPIGTNGDYFTSPVAHPAFAVLIASQLQAMWRALDRPTQFHVVEIGAGYGVLAHDIIQYAQKMENGFGKAIEYLTLDRSATTQLQTLAPLVTQRLITDKIPLTNIVGCVLTNELFDAFPVNRFRVQDGTLLEIYVTVCDEKLIEILEIPSNPRIAKLFDQLTLPISEGYEFEVNPKIGDWMNQVSKAIDIGFIITIDYGYTAEELGSPEKAHGTLQTHYNHITERNPYIRIGKQDITAHVNFSDLMAEGSAVGLRTVGIVSQSEFLYRLGFAQLLSEINQLRIHSSQKNENTMAMRELVNLDGLGKFKVLVQEKNTCVSNLDEISPCLHGTDANLCQEYSSQIPLLQPHHISLAKGRYPHTSWEIENLWPTNYDIDKLPII